MHRWLPGPCVLVVAFLLWPATRAAAQGSGSVTRTGHCGTLAHNLYRACYDDKAGKWFVDEPTNDRFTNRDRVEIEIQHFNFLRYTLSFDVKEEKSTSYEFLAKLWTSILGLDLGSLAGTLGASDTGAKDLSKSVQAVLRRTNALDLTITRILESVRGTGLSAAQVGALHAAIHDDRSGCADDWNVGVPDPLLMCSVVHLQQGLDVAYQSMEHGVYTDADQFQASIKTLAETYQKTKAAYAALRDRTDKFLTLATKTEGVETKEGGKHGPGTRVTITLGATDGGGATTPIGDINYLVETTMPLVLHVGITFANIKDVTFQKIQRANGAAEDDLFQQTGSADNTKDFAVFLGWKLGSASSSGAPNTSWLSVLISLGTAAQSPGKSIFVGPSALLFNRMVITGGVAFGKEIRGEQQTLTPNIFQVIAAHPQSSWFLAFSTKVH